MYELLYIVPTPFTEKDLPDIAKKIKTVIEETGGKIIKEKNLGNKKLAYPIKQVYRGFYILVNFRIDSNKIIELNKKLGLTTEVLRHLITKQLKKNVKEKKKEKDFSKIEEKKKTDNKDEEKKEKNDKVNLKKLGKKIDNLFNI